MDNLPNELIYLLGLIDPIVYNRLVRLNWRYYWIVRSCVKTHGLVPPRISEIKKLIDRVKVFSLQRPDQGVREFYLGENVIHLHEDRQTIIYPLQSLDLLIQESLDEGLIWFNLKTVYLIGSQRLSYLKYSNTGVDRLIDRIVKERIRYYRSKPITYKVIGDLTDLIGEYIDIIGSPKESWKWNETLPKILGTQDLLTRLTVNIDFIKRLLSE